MGILGKQKANALEKQNQQKQKAAQRKIEGERLIQQQKTEDERLRNIQRLKEVTILSEDEIKYLIKVIATTKFDGLDMQIIYGITAKLQNQLKNKGKWDGTD